MPSFRHRVLRNYMLGIASIVVGAGFTSSTGSMLPLAMGGAVGVMCTVSLVKAIASGRLSRSRRS